MNTNLEMTQVGTHTFIYKDKPAIKDKVNLCPDHKLYNLSTVLVAIYSFLSWTDFIFNLFLMTFLYFTYYTVLRGMERRMNERIEQQNQIASLYKNKSPGVVKRMQNLKQFQQI